MVEIAVDILFSQIFVISKKKGTLENFWTQFGTLYYKEVSKFGIPAFCYKLMAPKITKCGDLL